MKPLKITQQLTDRSSEALQKYFNEISKIPMLTEEEEYEVAMKAKAGDIFARERLAKSNLRFVVSVAKQYKNKNVPLIDLISSGNRGLYESVKKYDPELGNKFISYAVWHVRARIIEHLNKHSDTIALPGKKKDQIRNLKRVIESLEQYFEREPTIDEIYDEVHMDFSYEQVKVLLESDDISVSSYDKVITEDGFTLLDVMSGEENDSDYLTRNSDIDGRIKALLSTLGMRERDILVNYYGIGCDKMEMVDIAERWSLTKTTVVNNRNTALRKLNRLVKREGLENFLQTL